MHREVLYSASLVLSPNPDQVPLWKRLAAYPDDWYSIGWVEFNGWQHTKGSLEN